MSGREVSRACPLQGRGSVENTLSSNSGRLSGVCVQQTGVRSVHSVVPSYGEIVPWWLSLIYSLRGAAFKPLIYLLSLQHTNQPRARTARSSLSKALLSPENNSGICRTWCQQASLLGYLLCGHTHCPAALGVLSEEAGWKQDQADRDTRPQAWGVCRSTTTCMPPGTLALLSTLW